MPAIATWFAARPETCRGVEGVVILKVNPGSAAKAAGLKGATVSQNGGGVPGDTIVAIVVKPVRSVAELLARLDDYEVGDTVQVMLFRENRKTDVPVVLQSGV